MKTHVLDASALMTFFEDHPGAETVEELLAKAAEAKRPLLMSAVNWGEACCSAWRARGEKTAAAKLHEIAQLPSQVFDVDMELANLAASLKVGSAGPRCWDPRFFFRKSRRPHRLRSALHLLPYADCFAAALAQARKATLVTNDKDFERVGTALKILWV